MRPRSTRPRERGRGGQLAWLRTVVKHIPPTALTATLTATAVTLGPTAGERMDEGRNWSLRGAPMNVPMDGTWTAF